jgi:hypothetical protein
VSLAIVDACFLINWSWFRQRNDLLNLFTRLVVPTPVLVEVRTERARSYLAELVVSRRLLIAPRVQAVDQLALKLFEVIDAEPHLPTIDPPEAYALALAKHMRVPLLTDNAAPKLATRYVEEVKDVEVLDSLDVLARLYLSTRLRSKVEEFMRDTGVLFSEGRLRDYGVAP